MERLPAAGQLSATKIADASATNIADAGRKRCEQDTMPDNMHPCIGLEDYELVIQFQ